MKKIPNRPNSLSVRTYFWAYWTLTNDGFPDRGMKKKPRKEYVRWIAISEYGISFQLLLLFSWTTTILLRTATTPTTTELRNEFQRAKASITTRTGEHFTCIYPMACFLLLINILAVNRHNWSSRNDIALCRFISIHQSQYFVLGQWTLSLSVRIH